MVGDTKMVQDLGARRLRHRDHTLEPAGDPALHAGEAVPAPQRKPSPAGRVRQLDLPVDVNRVVDRGHQRHAEPGRPEHSVAKALVVVDHVVLAEAPPHQPAGPQRECHWLSEPGGQHGGHLEHIHPVAVLAAARQPERIGFPVQVEARHWCQADIFLKLRIGLAGEDVHGVPQSHQFTTQVTHIHALAAAEGISSVVNNATRNRSSVK